MSDLFDKLLPADKPFRVELVDPDTGETIADENGKASYIAVYSMDGAIGREFDKKSRDAALEDTSKGRTHKVDPFEQNQDKCAAVTAEWYLVDPETKQSLDIPCTVENAKKLYSRPLSMWIFSPVYNAASNHANFIKRSAKSSTLTQSGTSETVAS